MRTLVTGGTVVTASDTVAADVLIVDEQVAAVGIDVRAGAGVDRVVDATGRYVLPGGVDVHTHMELQTPYAVASDDFATGTAAAAWGGTTTIVDYAGHDYGEPLLAGLARWRQKAAKSHLDHGLHMMVREVNDRVLAELPALVAAGVSSIKLFMAYPGVYMVDDAAIFRVLGAAQEYGVLVAMHAENGGPIDVLIERHVAAGDTAPIFHARYRPAAMEGEATVRAARDRGVAVYAETCPQYLYLSDADLARPGFEGAKYVCSPPLRAAMDQHELWTGLRQGDVQVVATDHCPFRL